MSAVRLFVALALPEEARDSLAEWRSRALGGVSALRLLDPASLHVTLCFLGWQDEEEVDRVGEACASAVGPPVGSGVGDGMRSGVGSGVGELSLGGAFWLPERGRPRVAAVSVVDPSGGVAALQSRLSEALSAGGWYTPERRPFLAHVTVARVGKDARVRRSALPDPPAVRFAGSRVVLYRSVLGAGGARYEALRVFEPL